MGTVYEPAAAGHGRTHQVMSTPVFDSAKHTPRAADGTFSEVHHPEGTVTRAAPAPRSYDPEQVAKGILNVLREIPEGWTRELFYGTHKAV
jgi:hypothetical protein